MNNTTDKLVQKEAAKAYLKYYWKIYHIFIIGIVMSIALYLLQLIPLLSAWGSLVKALNFFSSIILQASFVTLVYEIVVRREVDGKIQQSIKTTISKELYQQWNLQTESFADSVGNAILLDDVVKKRLLKPEAINEIILSCLRTQLHEKGMSEELYKGVISPVLDRFRSEKTRRVLTGYHCVVSLSKCELPYLGKFYFNINISVEYKFKLNTSKIVLGCTNKKYRYGDEAGANQPFYMYSLPDVPDKYLKKLFKVTSVQIIYNNQRISLSSPVFKMEEGVLSVIYENDKLTKLIGKEVNISYEFKSVIWKLGVFKLKTIVPTNNFYLLFITGDTDIIHLSLTDYFISSGNTSSINSKSGASIQKGINVDGWIFPKSGLTVAWKCVAVSDYNRKDIFNMIEQKKEPTLINKEVINMMDNGGDD